MEIKRPSKDGQPQIKKPSKDGQPQKDNIISRRDFLKALPPLIGLLFPALTAGCRGPNANEIAEAIVIAQQTMEAGRDSTPTETATEPTKEPTGESTKEPTEKSPKTATPTLDQRLKDAAINYARKTGDDVRKVERLIREIYFSLPPDMPFVAQKNGLIPHTTQAMNMPVPPSQDPREPSIFVQASQRGYYNISGGYVFAAVLIDGKLYNFAKPWEDKTTQIVFFIGSNKINTPIGLYNYAPGGTFGTGASYSHYQESQFPNRTVIDRVWLADGVLQAALRDGPSGKTVVSFVDTETGEVYEYTWQRDRQERIKWVKNKYNLSPLP